jgi:hypothetical protein
MKFLVGYTIWEIITVMVISSIVITLAVSVFFRIQVYFHSETRNYTSGADFIVLSDLLKMDLDMAKNIQCKDNTLYIIAEKSSACYQFNKEFIVRKVSQLSDTFRITAIDFLIETLSDHPLLVRQVEFQVKMKDLTIPFFYSKEYEKQVLYQTDKANEYKSE